MSGARLPIVIYAVEWGNEFPAEVDSLWQTREDAETACAKKNAEALALGMWKVNKWTVK